MSSKDKIIKYYKINISENDDGITEYKCYKVLKENNNPIIISYDLENVIKELSSLKKDKEDNINFLLNVIKFGVASVFFLNFIVILI